MTVVQSKSNAVATDAAANNNNNNNNEVSFRDRAEVIGRSGKGGVDVTPLVSNKIGYHNYSNNNNNISGGGGGGGGYQMNGQRTATHTAATPRRPIVVAVEEDDDLPLGDDVIPGPPAEPESEVLKPQKEVILKKKNNNNNNKSPGSSRLGMSLGSNRDNFNSSSRDNKLGTNSHHSMLYNLGDPSNSDLDLSSTEHLIKGNGILASRADLGLAPEEFAAGCNLLQAAAVGDLRRVEELLLKRPHHVNFRDYDRRTALHVAASEGQLEIVKFLVEAKKVYSW